MRLVVISPASAVLAVAAACTGPCLHVENPGRHTVLVDGVEPSDRVVPFRYFGTASIDALPAPLANGRPDWSVVPARTLVAIEPPVTGWIFPLDLPIGLVDRALAGRGDVAALAVVAPAPATPAPESAAEAAELTALGQRAHAARVAR
jgi:hypothetical protein